MKAQKSIWLDVIDWLKETDPRLPSIFPTELPAEQSPDFWLQVTKIEMSTRKELSEKILLLIQNENFLSMSILESWLYRRRVEWAAQLCILKVKEGIEPDAQLHEVLIWLLIISWESDGCIGLWNHAERGGRPHPDNKDGLSPI